MKILLLGLNCSMWTLHFVEECLFKNNCEIWMLKKNDAIEEKKYISFFRKKGVHFIDCTKEIADINNKKNNLKVIYGYHSFVKKIVTIGNFDLINLHYVDFPDLVYAVVLKYFLKTRLVLSYWGSDLLRVEAKTLSIRGKFVRCADFVTFDNKDLEIKFKEMYKYVYNKSSEIVLFGLSILDIINEKSKEIPQVNLREKWGIPKDKTVIAVGYNGIPEQQHIKVLRAIAKLDNRYKEKIFLLLQMTYGGTKEYRAHVIMEAKKTECQYIKIERFLTDSEVADLRIITDIFINAQTTDAFSGSVCENLFSGTVLINAQWLCYQEFKENDFKYLEFKNIDEIGHFIIIAMEQGIDISENKELIWQLRSWECCAPKWIRVFHKLIQQNDMKRG